MKYKSVSTIAAILCGTLLAFAVFPAVFAQTGVKTAELELTPPAEAFDTAPMPVGIIHFSFATGKTEWLPFGKPANIQELAELAMRAQNPEKAPAGLDFSIRGEIDMRKAPVMILSEEAVRSILSTGNLPEKEATKKPQRINPDSYYILKDGTDQSFYVFKLKDHALQFVWIQIAYVHIPDRQSWKDNPDLAALLKEPQADSSANSEKKTNAITTRGNIVREWHKNEKEEEQARQEKQDEEWKKLIEAANQSGDTFPKTPEEITLLEILETMEGPISLVDCVHSPAKCRRNELCPTRDIWVQLNNGIRELTRQITLEDILNTYQRHDAENGIFDYCI